MAEEVPHSTSKVSSLNTYDPIQSSAIIIADAQYQGNYERARFEGEGVYEFADGTVYRGEMHNGMFHGKVSRLPTSPDCSYN